MWSYEVLKFHDLYGIWGDLNRQVAQVTEKYVKLSEQIEATLNC